MFDIEKDWKTTEESEKQTSMACQNFCRHHAIIKAHKDKIKWPSWPQAYKCLGKERKMVNQKVSLLHVPPGLLIDRNDNGPKMHHYLWPESRHQMLLSCICQNRKFCSKQTGLVTFCSAKVCQKPGSHVRALPWRETVKPEKYIIPQCFFCKETLSLLDQNVLKVKSWLKGSGKQS